MKSDLGWDFETTREFVIRRPGAFAKLRPGSAIARVEALAEVMSGLDAARQSPSSSSKLRQPMKSFVFECVRRCPQLVYRKPLETVAHLQRLALSLGLDGEKEAMDVAATRGLVFMTDYARLQLNLN